MAHSINPQRTLALCRENPEKVKASEHWAFRAKESAPAPLQKPVNKMRPVEVMSSLRTALGDWPPNGRLKESGDHHAVVQGALSLQRLVEIASRGGCSLLMLFDRESVFYHDSSEMSDGGIAKAEAPFAALGLLYGSSCRQMYGESSTGCCLRI